MCPVQEDLQRHCGNYARNGRRKGLQQAKWPEKVGGQRAVAVSGFVEKLKKRVGWRQRDARFPTERTIEPFASPRSFSEMV